ncbi:hypothetical protein FB451DRAFT_1259586 [Mycena latifolia]|nr:hypothetical protein FB451DRAFT_1259586 [Mycena latifolia]
MSSPFTSKLGTNYCPKDEEIPEIRALLIEPTLRLKRLTDEIADMQKAIDKLREEWNSLGVYVEAHKALISPVRRLPLDIIQEIFVACIPPQRNCVMSAREAPVLLGRICSAWRAISLSTPRLWARLHIVEPTRPYDTAPTACTAFDAKFAQRLETTKDWLGRSGQCPLSISLEGGQVNFGGPVGVTLPDILPDSSRFVEALIPFASRWQHIQFSLSAPIPDSLSRLTENEVPILRRIEVYERSEPGEHWASFGIFRGPKVTEFSISAGNLSPTGLSLRWGQLTVFEMIDITWGSGITLTSDMAVQILSWCPELRVCRLAVNDPPNWQGAGVGSIIECPYLRTLDTECVYPAYTLRRLFCRLSLPDLGHFKLRGSCDESWHETLSFSHFLAASPRLESIDISTETFSKTALVALLNGLPPTMQQLEVTQMWSPSGTEPLDDDVFDILTPSPTDPAPRCPALRTLLVSQCSTLSDEALMHFITSRMTAEYCGRLERVEIGFTRNMQVDLRASLRAFTDAGLQLALTYPPQVPLRFSPWLGLDEPVIAY